MGNEMRGKVCVCVCLKLFTFCKKSNVFEIGFRMFEIIFFISKGFFKLVDLRRIIIFEGAFEFENKFCFNRNI